MICDVCHQRPAIYGDGLTFNRCDKCEAEFRNNSGVPEATQQAPLEGTSFEHKTIPGLTSIIIPVYMKDYNLFHLTGDCIGSVREHTKSGDYELIIVDNGSPLQPPSLESYYADKIVKNEKNEGYTKAINQGIRVSFGEYIVLLSNDVKVYDGWLEGLKNALDNGLDLAMAHPMYSLTEPFARGFEADQVLKGQKKFDPIPGGNDFSCVMLKKSLIDEIGTFDERFFNYCSDVDFLKNMELTGRKYGMVDLVAVHHISSATGYSIPETPEIMNEDKKKFEEKWLENIVEFVDIKKEDIEDGIQFIPNSLIRTPETGDSIYLVKDNKTHHIKNPETLFALGFNFGQDKIITREEFKTYEKGEPIDMTNVERFKSA